MKPPSDPPRSRDHKREPLSTNSRQTHLVDRGQVVEELERRGRDVEGRGRRAFRSGGVGIGRSRSSCAAAEAAAAARSSASSSHRYESLFFFSGFSPRGEKTAEEEKRREGKRREEKRKCDEN